MSVPLLDLHIQHIVNFTISQVQKDPDRYIPEIFGNAKLDPHTALYGDSLITEVKKWVTSTKLPCVLGYDMDPTQIPGVSIGLERSSPSQAYLGDMAGYLTESLQPYEREILVKKFVPKELIPSSDGEFITVVLPDSLDSDSSQLASLPGLIIRDKNGHEYGIGSDKTNPTAIQIQTPLSVADLSEIEIISPIKEATYKFEAMLYEEVAIVTIHGHANRSEGLWLWAIVQWGLLKYRTLLIQLFGLDLAVPMAGDFLKDPGFMGENIWRRFITLSAKTNWSWSGNRTQDVVAFLYSIKAHSSNQPENEVDIPVP